MALAAPGRGCNGSRVGDAMEGPRLDAHARAGSQRQKRQRACACACAGWVDYERGELDVACPERRG